MRRMFTPPTAGSRIQTRAGLPQSLRRADALEDRGVAICRYYLYAMETFANPDVWTARSSALGTMVTHSVAYDVGWHMPNFMYEDRQLLRDIRDSPTRVSTIRLLWEAGSQRLFECERPHAHRMRPVPRDPMSLDGWPVGAYDSTMDLADLPAHAGTWEHEYDSLVITVSPKNVAQSDYLGVVKQWRDGAKFMYNLTMPQLRMEWLNYIYQCIMLWSTAPVRPAIAPVRPAIAPIQPATAPDPPRY